MYETDTLKMERMGEKEREGERECVFVYTCVQCKYDVYIARGNQPAATSITFILKESSFSTKVLM